jgi:hypothetical protein
MTTLHTETAEIFKHNLDALSKGDWFQLEPCGDFYIKLYTDRAFNVNEAAVVDINSTIGVIYHSNITIKI